jgi:glycosyltransferase involved in cell wall biosynthesis
MAKSHSPLRIAVDLTPVITNGENGGSKVLTMTLFQRLQTLKDYQFVLLTAPWNHSELAQYETENTTCLVMEHLRPDNAPPSPDSSNRYLRFAKKIVRKARNQFNHLPGGSRALQLAKKVALKLKTKLKPAKTLLQQHQIDLLFCPFSAPTYAEPGTPIVAIVYDLQHLDHPEFFSAQERRQRDDFLANLLKVADRIVCISDFSRQSFIDKLQAEPSKLSVVHISVYDRWLSLDDDAVQTHLHALGLQPGSYTFYPANYWPHKNHRTLLQAYQIYQERCPGQALDLVFTGALKQEEDKLRQIVSDMGLGDRVHFLGYLPDEVLEAVWKGCQFLTFPSLYEGFGIPIVEAMAFGKPVLCSTAGSLPEVGGDAVLYCNPLDPLDIADGMVKLTQDIPLRQQLVEKGYEQLKQFDPQQMVSQYRQIFADVASKR